MSDWVPEVPQVEGPQVEEPFTDGPEDSRWVKMATAYIGRPRREENRSHHQHRTTHWFGRTEHYHYGNSDDLLGFNVGPLRVGLGRRRRGRR